MSDLHAWKSWIDNKHTKMKVKVTPMIPGTGFRSHSITISDDGQMDKLTVLQSVDWESEMLTD